MGGFLTDGREALIAALKADATLAALVRTERSWIEFDERLWNRYIISPSRCPFVCVAPAAGEMGQSANWLHDYPQTLRIGIGVLGNNPETMETMLVRLYAVLWAEQDNLLDLAENGLVNVTCGGTRWHARPSDTKGLFIWLSATDVVLMWKRTQPHA